MRALLVDHDIPLIESMTRAVRDFCLLDIVTSRDLCLEKLRSDEFDIVIVCEQLTDGAGLDLLAQITQRHPSTLRAFAASPQRLMHMRGRLEPFNLFQVVRYPLVPSELRAMLKSAEAAQAANADLTNVQHIVLEGESAAEAPKESEVPTIEVTQLDLAKLELAPDWQPDTSFSVPQSLREATRGYDSSLTIKHGSAGKGASSARRAIGTKGNAGFGEYAATNASRSAKVISFDPRARRVVIVMTRDKDACDAVVAAVAGRAVSVQQVNDEAALTKALKGQGAMGVLVDLGLSGGTPRRFLEKVCAVTADTFVCAVGRASDSAHIAPLLSKGLVQRFLVKPMNRAQTRAALEPLLAQAKRADSVTNEDVPFASLIDRVTVTDLRASRRKVSWADQLARMQLKHWQWVLGGAVLGTAAMLGLAYALS